MHEEDRDDGEEEQAVGAARPRAGYGKPPAEHRFRKGQSGNPKGRPKGSTSKRATVKRVLLEEHEVVEDDRSAPRTTLELILTVLRNLAFAGNNGAFTELEKLEARYSLEPPSGKASVLLVPGRLTPEEWTRRFSLKPVSQSE
jgi:hypothetical protein